jgi:uncharacterized membrane protein YeaQ/YmgE (transglycosylase-associated protein family)
MYPTLFRIGRFEITSFGVLVAVAALVRPQRAAQAALDAAVFGLIGAFVGAKLLWTFEHYGEEPVISLLVSRGGLSWFSGLVGGVGAGFAVIRVPPVPFRVRACSGDAGLGPRTCHRACRLLPGGR